jgi:hypothetical protein
MSKRRKKKKKTSGKVMNQTGESFRQVLKQRKNGKNKILISVWKMLQTIMQNYKAKLKEESSYNFIMTLIAEADEILQKTNLTIKDYNRFVEIGKKLTNTEVEYIYSWLAEGFYLRLPEIAEKEGNYDFIKDGEFYVA